MSPVCPGHGLEALVGWWSSVVQGTYVVALGQYSKFEETKKGSFIIVGHLFRKQRTFMIHN